MWQYQHLRRIDFRTLPIIFGLMVMSILVIASTTYDMQLSETKSFFTPYVKNQMKWFGVGTIAYLLFAGLDYHKLRDWAWVLYIISIVLLLGLFLATPIQYVHRWYKIPFIGGALQPSEYAKLSLVLIISWFLERRGCSLYHGGFLFQVLGIIFLPFFLILKQPDLGSALVLLPIALSMLYFGGIHKSVVKIMLGIGVIMLCLISLIFTGILPYQKMKPVANYFLKEYQYERLNPETYHHNAAKTAIALGKYMGSGWKKSTFTGRQFLPAAHTDSVFSAFTEEFGLFGATCMLLFFFFLIYCSFQVTAVARDQFGQILSAGIAVYLAVHVIINVGMMCGFLPITGVPLILVTYGGSSVTLTMSALGILQSIYIRRYIF